MSIRLLAIELYKARQKVDTLEKQLAACELSEKDKLAVERKAAVREWETLRRMLDGKKETSCSGGRFH
ncbi:MAG: hypothetical protein CSA20_04025 [Deltaproteobacteria bacterium]|nr:MAG: hypothetical protein CSB23_01425 [Deltaproteobacteria bacterium]PIE73258.1 MAG: hypothetical protein CSA20_04025 [Deltaproteobacteria bacterium]